MTTPHADAATVFVRYGHRIDLDRLTHDDLPRITGVEEARAILRAMLDWTYPGVADLRTVYRCVHDCGRVWYTDHEGLAGACLRADDRCSGWTSRLMVGPGQHLPGIEAAGKIEGIGYVVADERGELLQGASAVQVYRWVEARRGEGMEASGNPDTGCARSSGMRGDG